MFGTSRNDTQTAGTDDQQPAVIPDNPFTESPEPTTANPAPQAVEPNSVLPADPKPTVAEPTPSAVPTAADDSLVTLKQEALQSLQPLVSHLDQTPEEKFKTTMMLIQATDNPSLVKEAYEAANQITDEKARAQALLDVVNEINYFTHKDEK
jgi:hypothetical protein